MTEMLSWSIDLGRWGGVRVRIHFLLALCVLLGPLFASISPTVDHPVARSACVMVLYLIALAVHELGHAAAAYFTGIEPEDVLLGPWGNIVPPPVSFRPQESPWLALGGILASGGVALVCAIGLSMSGAIMVFSPFGNLIDAGAPRVIAAPAPELARAFSTVWFVGWFGWINWVLFLLNAIPALPMDGGRVLRSIVARSSIHPRDSLIAPITARACAALLAVIGVFRLLEGRVGDFITTILLAALIELTYRLEARMFDEGGDYETGAYGYDFSEGYTSLEGSSAKVRPQREGTIRRWRRRRSELRVQRAAAKQAAEERRLDEILDKLHRFGRPALSKEENRFLLRVSSRLKGRTRSDG